MPLAEAAELTEEMAEEMAELAELTTEEAAERSEEAPLKGHAIIVSLCMTTRVKLAHEATPLTLGVTETPASAHWQDTKSA